MSRRIQAAELIGMNVVFRVDASIEIGTGHVMRCLTLADGLRQRGIVCRFVCREHAGNLIDAIAGRGFTVHAIPVVGAKGYEDEEPALDHKRWLGGDWRSDAAMTLESIGAIEVDWLVVDHYSLDARWERCLRSSCKALLVIDDLADRAHACDVLLDQNHGRRPADYAERVTDDCKILVGPRFALLRPDFSELRAKSLERRKNSQLRRLLISLGGVDKDNATGAVLEALRSCRLSNDVRLTVVLGSHSPYLAQVRAMTVEMPWATELLVDVRDMAALMADCDLAIGAAGIAAWERCCLGLPSLIVLLAANQKPGARALETSGAAIILGDISMIAAELPRALQSLGSTACLVEISDAAEALCDGRGASRVVALLDSWSNELLFVREVEPSDDDLLFRWANDPQTRLNAFNSDVIEWDSHQQWLSRKLLDREGCVFLIGCLPDGVPCGQVRFDRELNGDWMIDYSVAPEFRGLGLGSRLLAATIDVLIHRIPAATLVGMVKPFNKPSIKVFESLGFRTGPVMVDGLHVFSRSSMDA